jgi:PTH2 family peptidyl-tRNA hydrolase
MSEVKQVIVVRKDLNMRKGKIAAQVAHASMKVLLDKMTFTDMSLTTPPSDNPRFTEMSMIIPKSSGLYDWLAGSFTKVVVSINSLDELLLLQTKANDAGIINAVITDAGRTEFHGEPTVTCIAIGPDESEKIDIITGDLPLL